MSCDDSFLILTKLHSIFEVPSSRPVTTIFNTFNLETVTFFHALQFSINQFFCIFSVENLFHPDSYCEIPHLDVGKYFQEFTGRYYVMNKEKAEEYPDDALETRTVIEGLSREEMLE